MKIHGWTYEGVPFVPIMSARWQLSKTTNYDCYATDQFGCPVIPDTHLVGRLESK